MKILIDIGHPAHIHFFKHFAWQMLKKNHQVLFSLRKKDINEVLLKDYDFPYIKYGNTYNNYLGKIWGLFKFGFLLFMVVKKFKPDLTLSHSSFYLAQVSWLLGYKNITFEDTGNMEQVLLYKYFTDSIISPSCYLKNHGKKHLFYNGYHELAYLHPNHCNPNKDVLQELKLKKHERYCIIRFVSWDASHDINHHGFSLKNKFLLVKEMQKYVKVFISSENQLPKQLEKYRFPLENGKMEDAMAYASLIFGESATMVSEGAVLGVPGIYIDNTGRFYTEEQEKKYKIVFRYSESPEDQIEAIKKAASILELNDSDSYMVCKERILNDKIDVTSFMIWFVENYPESISKVKADSNYTNKFK